MYTWGKFIKNNKLLLSYGFFFNFFSSFGQTFFISLFVPYWIADIHISKSEFGTMYGLISVASALTLPLIGRYIDFIPLRKFSIIIFIGLIISVFILSGANSFLFLLGGLFLVRLLGQGLMTHTSSTSIAKLFDKNRGKALGFTSLGHPFAQFILPLLFAFSCTLVDWRISLILLAVLSLAIMLPLIARIPNEKADKELKTSRSKKIGMRDGSHFLLTSKFWLIALNIFVMPFLGTAIILYQYTIAESRFWDSSWVVFSFSFYAIFSGFSLFFSGALIDRFSGIRLFAYYLLPALVGFIAMLIFNDKWIFPVFYALLGISSGLGSTIKTAVQAEIYGTGRLGEVRSYLSTILVLGTAAGPPVFGYLLDIDAPMNYIMSGAAILIFVIFITSLLLNNKPNHG
ncbi:MAG: MFS transporter [Dysgonomonas sp.]|nr:MFS transporter [Dysgonomonas sp.]